MNVLFSLFPFFIIIVRIYSAVNYCHKIERSFCSSDLNYNWTVFPNTIGHTSQESAHLALNQFLPLIETGCSQYLRHFLCSLYFPVCVGLFKPIKPCRSLCQSARSPCKSEIRKLNIEWPDYFKCSEFPVTGLCISDEVSDFSALSFTLENTRLGKATVDETGNIKHAGDWSSKDGLLNKIDKCEKMKLPMCRNWLPYNETHYPNLIGHETQEMAQQDMNILELVAESGCSPYLQLFLCIIHAPVCTLSPEPIPPCKSLCRRVRSECKGLIMETEIGWPRSWSCRRFPSSGLCLGEYEHEVDWSWYRNVVTAAEKRQFELKFTPTTIDGNVARSYDRSNQTIAFAKGANKKKNYNTTESFFNKVHFPNKNEFPVLTKGNCENIREHICKHSSIPYNWTAFPNPLGHVDQITAGQELRQYKHLLKSGSSSNLRLFLCSVYIPSCTALTVSKPPCRSLCEKAKAYFKNVTIGSWFNVMQCYQYPELGECYAETYLEKNHLSETDSYSIKKDKVAITHPSSSSSLSSSWSLLSSSESSLTSSLSPSLSSSTTKTLSSSSVSFKSTVSASLRHCQNIAIPLCMHRIEYNRTMFPNILGHSSQSIAAQDMSQFKDLIESGCSADLRFFMCSIYVPICMDTDEPILPCRGLCESALEGCTETLINLKLSWPSISRCRDFPATGRCVSNPERGGIIIEERTTSTTEQPISSTPANKCQRITIPFCNHGIEYNQTQYPNLLGHTDQNIASQDMKQFDELIESGCSKDLRFFLCSIFAPMCTFLNDPIPPCRGLCESALEECSDVLVSLQLPWPRISQCRDFPVTGLCVCSPRLKEKKAKIEETTVITTKPTRPTSAYGCQDITIPFCDHDIEYNQTQFPNLFGHENQNIATDDMTKFEELIESGCSDHLRLFLCLVFAPICSVPDVTIPPCRGLCETARQGCSDTLISLQLEWPSALECSAFPFTGLCVGSYWEEIHKKQSSVDKQDIPSAALEITTSTPYQNYKCTNISLDFCSKGILYKMTRFPNLLGHKSQEEVIQAFFELEPLVNSKCSNVLREFVCPLYAPMCILGFSPLPPCRSLCDRASRACWRSRKGDFFWPNNLRCSNFPESGMCIGKAQRREKNRIIQVDGEMEKSLHHKCVSLHHPFCKRNIPYSMTRFPNIFEHENHGAASTNLDVFHILLGTECSQQLGILLCTAHFPMCTNLVDPVPPCRSLCRSVKKSCRDAMMLYGMRWPEELKCRKFPLSGLCIGKIKDIQTKKHIWMEKFGKENINESEINVNESVGPKCQSLENTTCSSFLPYNMTTFPNLLGLENLEEAEKMVQTFTSLKEYGCSDHLNLFICSSYFPKCGDRSSTMILPCQSLCEKVRVDCKSKLDEHGFGWPEELDCLQFQRTGPCIDKDTNMEIPYHIVTTSVPVGEKEEIENESERESTNRPTNLTDQKCESVGLSVCQDTLPYNTTSYPNYFGHRNKKDVTYDIHFYSHMFKTQCSKYFKFFLCTVLFPPCRGSLDPLIVPCRSICEDTKKGCEVLLNRFGFGWPPFLDCYNFPKSNSCIEYEKPKSVLREEKSDVVGPDNTPWQSKCETIPIGMCQKVLPYNLSSTPNLFHQNLQEAAVELQTFCPMVRKCNKYTRLFLCTLYFPPCVADLIIHPCRLLCKEAKRGCKYSSKRSRGVWPAYMQCDMFPDSKLCIKDEKAEILTRIEERINDDINNKSRDVSRNSNIFIDRCEDVTIPLCQGLSYNRTSYHPLLQHRKQFEALMELRNLPYPLQTSLTKLKCSRYINQYLCAIFAPPCSNNSLTILKPCRSFCEKAREGCEDELKRSGNPWPSFLQCERFTESEDCYKDGDVVETIKGISTFKACKYNPTAVEDILYVYAQHDQCQAIDNSICSVDIPYNVTFSPKNSGYPTRNNEEITFFSPLIEEGCSKYMRLFLCAVFMPPCTGESDRILPCRSLCYAVQDGCEKQMLEYTNYWSHCIECSQFPETGCLGGNTTILIQSPNSPEKEKKSSHAINDTICRNALPYHMAFFPNAMGHKNKTAAVTNLDRLLPLFKIGCSKHMYLFLCSSHFPSCGNDSHSISPCRSLCQKVHEDCGTFLDRAGFHWPDNLHCDKFPESGECINDGGRLDTPGMTRNIASKGKEHVEENENVRNGSSLSFFKVREIQTCEDIRIYFCRREIPYNVTSFPNWFNHSSQEQAAVEFDQFHPLLLIKCSDVLRLFLCASHIPICISGSAIPPCQSLCEKVKHGCQNVMTSFGLSWPDRLRCELFPVSEPCVSTALKESTEEKLFEEEVREETDLTRETCKPITTAFCKGELPYNETAFPNDLGHDNQELAAKELQEFYPLVHEKCSKYLRLFLCSAFIPPCKNATIILPCRSLCENVRNDCRFYLNVYGFRWSETLHCDHFPESDNCLWVSDPTIPVIEPWGATRRLPPLERDLEANKKIETLTIVDPVLPQHQCQHLVVHQCLRDIPYNMTSFPNVLGGVVTQHEANEILRKFYPLIKSQCSNNIRLLLCSVYAPKCTTEKLYNPPCRSLCHRTRKECRGALEQYGMQWPAVLRCKRFSNDSQCLK